MNLFRNLSHFIFEKESTENEIDKENRRTLTGQQVNELEKKLSDQLVMNQRLNSEFKRKFNEIQRSIRSLLGYKAYFDEENQIKLVWGNNTENFFIFKVKLKKRHRGILLHSKLTLSICKRCFAHFCFIFKINKDMSLSLKETNFARANSHLIDIFIRGFDSILGFLAAVHFEQYGKRLLIENRL